jgi:hypothetical protein
MMESQNAIDPLIQRRTPLNIILTQVVSNAGQNYFFSIFCDFC